MDEITLQIASNINYNNSKCNYKFAKNIENAFEN